MPTRRSENQLLFPWLSAHAVKLRGLLQCPEFVQLHRCRAAMSNHRRRKASAGGASNSTVVPAFAGTTPVRTTPVRTMALLHSRPDRIVLQSIVVIGLAQRAVA